MEKAQDRLALARVAIVAIALATAGAVLNGRHRGPEATHPLLSLASWAKRSGDNDVYNASENYLKRGPHDLKAVCLTFDDGPHPTSGATLLDILKRENVKATFFVVGQRVQEHPELVRRMLAEGHEVGNHTQDHLRLTKLKPEEIYRELKDCDTTVQRLTGHRMTLMRPPGFDVNADVMAQAKRFNYTIVGWNIGAKDYVPGRSLADMNSAEAATLGATPDVLVERVTKQLKNGVIILLHDNPVTVEAMPEIIRRIKAEGYEFRTTAEFLQDLPKPVTLVANPACESR